MFSLSYNGQMAVESNPEAAAHELLDALFTIRTGTGPVRVQTGQVRPQPTGALFIVSLTAEADIGTLESVQTDLANELVNLGFETDLKTATDQIRVTK
jgi:hypothetical protein